MALKTDYKDDAYEGKRKYLLIDNGDGTYSLDDVTDYKVIGDFFNSYDINITNATINQNTKGLVDERTLTNRQILDERNTTDKQIQSSNQKIDTLNVELTRVQNVTFTVGGWSSSAPYTQQVAVSGMEETDNPIPGLVYPASITEAQKESIDKSSDMITELETFNGYIRATCRFKKPIANITIGLKGR